MTDESEEVTSAGRRVSRYDILEKIGQGGMGEVFLARDASLDRFVALKFLPSQSRGDSTERKRFVRGAKSAAALDHPYICKIYEVGEAEGKLFIAMEYVRGETLKTRLARGPFPLEEAIRVAREIAEALETAHGEDIVHRDLKPANIMLTVGGHVKVLDFGLAKRILSSDSGDSQFETASRVTEEGATLGTLAYMSPEQVRGQPMDPRSDIFSFGVILYEMIAGGHPFGRPTSIDTVAAILNQNPAPLGKDVPPSLQQVIARTLAKTPDERYQGMGELLSGLTLPATERSARKWRLFRIRKKGLVVAAVAVALAASIAALVPKWSRSAAALSSVAVIPFANLSQEPLETDYLADGMSEAIRERLASSGFRAASFEASSRFRESGAPARAIASELGVDGILTGSFRFSGDRVLASLSLLRGESEERLWIEELESRYEELFELQSRITEEVASRLRSRGTGERRANLDRAPTKSLEAYDLFLQGRHIVRDATRDASDVALRYFDRAIDVDRDFAEAKVSAGELHARRYVDGWGKGLPSLSLAENHFREAVELQPDSIRARHGLIRALVQRGQSEAALLEGRAALQAGGLDDVESLLAIADAYQGSGLDDLALPLYREAVETDPASEDARRAMIAAATWSGQFDEAMEAGRVYTRRFGESHEVEAHLGLSYQGAGDRFGAKAHYARAVELATAATGRSEPFGSSSVLDVYLYGGHLDESDGASWRRGEELARAKRVSDPSNLRIRIYQACFEALHSADAKPLEGLMPDALDTAEIREVAAVLATLGKGDLAARILGEALERGRVDGTWKVAMQLVSVSPDERSFDELRRAIESKAKRLRDAYPPAVSGR